MTMTQETNQDCALIALDWGTSSLRCYRFDGRGQVVERRAHPWGIMNLPAVGHGDDAHAPYRAALEAACGDWLKAAPAAPLIAAGMVGSKQGWREAAYLNVPLAPSLIGSQLTEVDTGLGRALWIVPGLLEPGALPNVMRGEETQVIGALQTRTERELLIGLPGTHSKWVRVVDGRIEHFDTFMTGEVYAALCGHTILGRTMQKPEVADDAAFLRGASVAKSAQGKAGMLSNIFSSRTLGLTGELAADAQPDYLSGLLIGHEIAALKNLHPTTPAIVLIGDAGLCRRYRLALDLYGLGPAVEAEGATEAGLWNLAQHAGLLA
jgi:2-dehydro-3-deoxygalactonokinase